MDKQALRKEIRDKKRAMTEAEIVAASQRLAELFVASEAYRQAKTIYGYLPYNQSHRCCTPSASANNHPRTSTRTSANYTKRYAL